jgi:hypothetical protein
MKTIEEIYAAINPLPAMLSAKGKAKPVVQLQIEANARIALHMNWVKRGAPNDWERNYECFIGDTAEEVTAEAIAFINDLPDAKTARLHEFMGQLGKVIDSGRDLGIEVDFLNPLTETMKRLSENIITYQAAKPSPLAEA